MIIDVWAWGWGANTETFLQVAREASLNPYVEGSIPSQPTFARSSVRGWRPSPGHRCPG